MVNRFALVAVVLVPVLAHADSKLVIDEEPDRGARSRLSATLGGATPTGVFGVEYTQNLHPNVELGAGAGIGITGPQVSLMPRLRVGRSNTAGLLGAGISGGTFNEPDLFNLCFSTGPCPNNNIKTTALWANAEAGVQLTSKGGTTFYLYGGIGKAIATGHCDRGNCSRVDRMTLPYLGIAFGHTL